MVITYCGNSCFKIQSGKLSIVTDPLPRFKGDIVLLIRAPEESEKTQWPPEANQILGPGEYEIQGVEVDGWSAKNGTTNYVATVEEMEQKTETQEKIVIKKKELAPGSKV